MADEDGLKAQKLLAQGTALGNVGKKQVALKGQKLSKFKAFALSSFIKKIKYSLQFLAISEIYAKFAP